MLVDSEGAGGRIRVTVGTDSPAGAILWGDGELISSLGDSSDNDWYKGENNRYMVGVDPKSWKGEPGDVEFSMSLWKGDEEEVIERSFSVIGETSPFILPTVPSGQVLLTPSVRSLFLTHPKLVEPDGILQDLRDAGVNCLEMSVFNNPADNWPTWDNYPRWSNDWEILTGRWIDWCVENEWDFLGIGDDYFRFQPQAIWTNDGLFNEQAIRKVARRLRESGRCRGIEMVDEAWHDPSVYMPEEMIGWHRDEGGPPIAWSSQDPYAYENPALSDYSSRYWANTQTSWKNRQDSLPQIFAAFKRASTQLRTDRSLGMLLGVAQSFYDKWVSGGDYTPGGDHLVNAGVRPQDIVAQIWMAEGIGATRFRGYSLDWLGWRNQRLNSPIGTLGLQTGARPGSVNWAGVSRAFNSVASRELALAGTPYLPTFSGRWMFSRRGLLVWGINTLERSLPSPNGPGTVITVGGEYVSNIVPPGGVIVWEGAYQIDTDVVQK